ncbi:unnamed protein product, partial [Mesorhabditis belari]|uniref:STAS domain-containing protein n=1 Tax=Mesorhabditis belari TaxID=2138241 RepID=A0AAF3FI79_9BILA
MTSNLLVCELNDTPSVSDVDEKNYYEKVNKNQYIFDEEFGFIASGKKKKSSEIIQEKLEDVRDYLKPSALYGWMPILKWLPKYNVKENLINDVIGGLTVGIMHVPQGMAYANLAGMRPENGLYTSLIPPFFYMCFGTSRHVSLGVFAVVSLMVGSCNLRLTQLLFEQKFSNSSMPIEESLFEQITYDIRVEIVTSLALLVGIIQILLGFLRLDFLTSFLSDQVIAGFTTGAAVHVFTAQLNKILGVSLPRASGIGKLFPIWLQLLSSIRFGEANLSTFLLSLSTISLLFIFKDYLDPLIKKLLKTKIPIPYDLFVIIFGTIFSYSFGFREKFSVKVIGKIPTGFPSTRAPNGSLFPLLFADAMAIAVVVLVVTISMGKLFAKKHNYKIDTRQEFYALGFMECLSSLFPVWPSSTALARTLVYEAAGTKTQLATVFSSLLLLTVIFFIGPFLEELPLCLLSCIIIVALKGMFMQLKQIPTLWRANKTDAFAFLISFIGTVVFDVVEGLALGVIFVLGVLIMKIQRARLVELGRMSHNKDKTYYKPSKNYRDAVVPDFTLCLHFSAPIIFTNAESFRSQLNQMIDGSIRNNNHGKHLLEQKMSRENSEPILRNAGVSIATSESQKNILSCTNTFKSRIKLPIQRVVIDLVGVPFVDFTGANSLIETILEKKKTGVLLMYSSANLEILSTLRQVESFEKHHLFAHFFPSIEDALDAEENENLYCSLK